MITGLPMSQIRRWGRALFLAVAALLSFEAGANLLYWLEKRSVYLGNHFSHSVPAYTPATLRLHPYFGFMPFYSPPQLAERGLQDNNFNLPQVQVYAKTFDHCCRFPITKQEHPHDYFVVLLGNSIAHGIGDYFQVAIGQDHDTALQASLERLPGAKGKHVVVLNLAIPGYHMPQELLELTYLIADGSQFDFILYYASAPEVVSARANETAGNLARDFPDWGVWRSTTRALEQSASSDASSLVGLYGLRSEQDAQRRIDSCETASCVVVNRALISVGSFLATHLLPPAAADGSLPHFADFPPVSRGAEYSVYAAAWARNSRMLASLAGQSGMGYAQVLLPSPWMHTRRPFAVAANEESEQAEDFRQVQQAMICATEELAASGVQALDATHVLDDADRVDPQVYLDSVGHIGHVGMRSVVEFTLDHLIDPSPP